MLKNYHANLVMLAVLSVLFQSSISIAEDSLKKAEKLSSIYQAAVADYQAVVQPFSTRTYSNESFVEYYQMPNGLTVMIGDQLFIHVESEFELEKLLVLFNLSLVKPISSQVYLVNVNSADTLSILEQLRLRPEVQQAYPDFIKQIRAR